MASQNNSLSFQGKSTNHHSKLPRRPPKFNWVGNGLDTSNAQQLSKCYSDNKKFTL